MSWKSWKAIPEHDWLQPYSSRALQFCIALNLAVDLEKHSISCTIIMPPEYSPAAFKLTKCFEESKNCEWLRAPLLLGCGELGRALNLNALTVLKGKNTTKNVDQKVFWRAWISLHCQTWWSTSRHADQSSNSRQKWIHSTGKYASHLGRETNQVIYSFYHSLIQFLGHVKSN